MSDFYTNISVSGKFILFRGVEGDKRVRRKIEYRPTFFLLSKEKSEYKSLAGDSVKPIQPGTIPECREFLERYESVDNFPIFGNNRYEYSFIADHFADDILWDYNKVCVAYLDIEVGSENGFPEPRDANEEITAITIKLKDNYFVFGCGDYIKHRDDVQPIVGKLRAQFEGEPGRDYQLNFWLAPPMTAKHDEKGHLVKKRFGPNTMRIFKVLAKLKGLRGTALDIFGKTDERRMERQLIRDYCAMMDTIITTLDAAHHALAVEIASLPMQVRGYGHVKMRNVEKMTKQRDDLLAAYQAIKTDDVAQAVAAE